MHDKKALSTKAQAQFLQFLLSLLLKTNGVHKKDILFKEAIMLMFQSTHTMVFLNLSKSTKVSTMKRSVHCLKFSIEPQRVFLAINLS